MKRKFSRILGVATALVLVLSLGLVMAVPVMAGNPTIVLTTSGGGITSLAGTPTGSGTEAGVHSITVSDATASTATGADAESNTAAGTIAAAIVADQTLTLTIAGEGITALLAAATADMTTLDAVALDIQTKINAVTTVADVTVTVVGTNPTKSFLITVVDAGVSNSITIIGGTATATVLTAATLAAGTDAKAVDTLAAASGSNGLWVVANGATLTITHTTTAGIASTLAGLKTLVIVADAFIEGITLAASGVLSAGTATVTVTAGAASLLVIATQPAGSVSGIALTTQPIIEAQDDSGNVDLTYTTDVVAATDDLGAPLTGTTTKAAVAGVADFAGLGLLYTATADQEVFQIDFTSTGITGVTSADVTCDVVATKILLTTEPASIISGVSMTTPVVTYVDEDDLVDVGIDADVVTVTENGDGTVAGDTATATDGVATFGSLIYTAVADGEAVTFTFTDDTANLNLNSLPVDSSALTADVVATKMAFFVQPLAGTNSGLVLGTQPTVQAQNADNTLDIGFTETVTITTDVGTLSGDVDIAAVLGVATFTDLVHTASADNVATTLTANDQDGVDTDLTSGTANSFTTLVIATKLVIVTQPAGAVSTAILVIQPVINAVDADGTRDADWVTACAVARETGTGTVTGGPVGAMVAGVATFTDVTVTETPVVYGSYTLRFTSGALTYVVSDAFKVFDKAIDLNDNAWTLISTDDYIISSGDDTSAFEGSVSLKYIYTGSSYVPAYVSDIKPVEAIYVKTTGDDGCLGLNYSTTASPGASNKSLLAGWNLISSATSTASNAGPVLSPLQYVDVGEEQGVGLATLVSQNSYNINTLDWYIDATTWGNLATKTMNSFDGYWVYMNAAKSFGVIPQ